ncbi:MAG: methyl-accepting chemotaxis protein [Negativicutes bacterium]|nr:methyl-accepting chemotaxis protein [Negativicutes bacterium]
MKRKTTIAQGMAVFFGVPIIILSILFGFCLYTFSATSNDYEDVINHTARRTVILMDMHHTFASSLADNRGYLMTGNTKFRDQALESINKMREAMTPWVTSTAASNPKLRAEGDNLLKMIDTYADGTKKVNDAYEKKDPALMEAAVAIARPAGTALDKQFESLAEMQTNSMNARVKSITNKQVTATRFITIAGIFIILAIFAITFWYGRQLTKRIGTVKKVVEDLGKLDLSQSDAHNTVNDELGAVLDSIIAMKNVLKGVVKTISSNAEQLAASSQEFTASTGQSAQAANQVANAITEVAKGAEEQSKAVHKSFEMADRVEHNIDDAVTMASTVTEIGSRAVAGTEQGKGIIKEAVAQMNHIGVSAGQVAEAVVKVEESSKQIDQIMSVITGIANQTNLLALNAAIEAARAGESGRGFAVVAEEVRKLAEGSQRAAQEIRELLAANNSNIQTAVSAMSRGEEDVKNGVAAVNEAGNSFASIADMIGKMAEETKRTTNALNQIRAASLQMKQTVANIETISSGSAAQTQTVSAATEEQSATMQQMSSSSEALAQMAADLQVAVAKFKI